MLRQRNTLHTGRAFARHLFKKGSDFQRKVAPVLDGLNNLAALRNSVRQFYEFAFVQVTWAVISVFAAAF